MRYSKHVDRLTFSGRKRGAFSKKVVVILNAAISHYSLKKNQIAIEANVHRSLVTHVLKGNKGSYRVAKAILLHIQKDFILSYPDFQKTIELLCSACHLSIISQNIQKCKKRIRGKNE